MCFYSLCVSIVYTLVSVCLDVCLCESFYCVCAGRPVCGVVCGVCVCECACVRARALARKRVSERMLTIFCFFCNHKTCDSLTRDLDQALRNPACYETEKSASCLRRIRHVIPAYS